MVTKRAFKMKSKAFFIILEELIIEANNKKKKIFLEGESPTLKTIQKINFKTTN